MTPEKDFLTELSELINRHSMENGSHTPDFILAQYMNDCLKAFNYATLKRDAWWDANKFDIEESFKENPPFSGPYKK